MLYRPVSLSFTPLLYSHIDNSNAATQADIVHFSCIWLVRVRVRFMFSYIVALYKQIKNCREVINNTPRLTVAQYSNGCLKDLYRNTSN